MAENLAKSLAIRSVVLNNLGSRDKAIGDFGLAIDIYNRLVEEENQGELAIELARTLTNRGIALRHHGDPKDAIRDQDRATEIETRLVEQEGRAEFAEDLVKSLNECAWLLLTCDPTDYRDEMRARELATKAAELTGHENPEILDTLALAYHVTGDNHSALGTQEQAIHFLPRGASPLRQEFEVRFNKYRKLTEGSSVSNRGRQNVEP